MFKRKKELSIEEVINKKLKGEAQTNALGFVAFLRAEGFSLKWNPKHNGWRFEFERNLVGMVYVARAGCELIVNICTLDFDGGGPADDELKEFAWAHAVACPLGCDGTEICEKSQKNLAIFGRVYENICITPLMIMNPDAKDLEHAKKLVLMIRQNRR